MQEIELSAGHIAYEDTGGSGPVVVLLHGLVMDGSVWSQVVQQLRPDHRCLVPTLPLGSHRKPMREDADLSLQKQQKEPPRTQVAECSPEWTPTRACSSPQDEVSEAGQWVCCSGLGASIDASSTLPALP